MQFFGLIICMHKKKQFLILCLVLIFCVSGCTMFRRYRPPIIYSKQVAEDQKEKQILESKIVPPLGKLIEGETFFYKVHWLGLDVGDATLSIKEKCPYDGHESYHVVLEASTNKVFSFFYTIKTKVESFVDTQTLKPIRYNSETYINKKFVFKYMSYDFDKKVVYAKDKKGDYTVEIPDNVIDPLGTFYYFRIIPIKLNEPINFVVNTGKKNFPMIVFVQKERRVKIPSGVFWAFLVEPTDNSQRQFDEVLNASGRMWIWFSSDEKRIPLILSLKVPFGTAVAFLTKMQATQTELTNKH